LVILSVKACGMITAVGFNAASSCAAIRAGISGVKMANLWDSSTGEYLQAARPETPQWWEGPDMLAELATPPIIECLESIPQEAPDSIPVFLLLSPPSRPFRHPDLEEIIVRGIEHRLQYKLPPGSTLINKGRSGIYHALQAAKQLIKDHRASHCIIVGVDSYLRQNVVEAYLKERRILTNDNSNGFIPGEAACAILVGQSGHESDGELCITALALGHETGIISNDHPVTGDGLTQAIKSALKEAEIMFSDTDFWLTDQNSEHYKVKECTLAQIRLERRYPPARPYQIWHPIEYLGEIGSAISPCLLGLALAAAKSGYSPGPLALMHVSNDDGERTALVLQWVEGK
jgi:3-oxoacyl-[acyl-carrier-protein] synthase I